MELQLAASATAAAAFLPLVLPICLYVGYTDMARMKIHNHAVLALAAVFLVVGPLVLPLPDYAMRLAQLGGVLVVGFILSSAGALGAGDAKFAAAAAPFIDPRDLGFLMPLMAATILAAFVTHRLARAGALRRLVPHWQSWHETRDFPFGLALGGTLGLYLIAAALWGQ